MARVLTEANGNSGANLTNSVKTKQCSRYWTDVAKKKKKSIKKDERPKCLQHKSLGTMGANYPMLYREIIVNTQFSKFNVSYYLIFWKI